MGALYHRCANFAASRFMQLLFGTLGRVHTLRPETMDRTGAFLLASNHISHFDPLIISGIVRRKIDWMAMAEFFPMLGVGHFLRAVDAFPADRDRADRTTIRTAIDRLKAGRIVGVFPEGGIRDGEGSLLNGAPLRPGASTLAHMAGIPILPCVILGSDRLYARKSWLPLRRTPIWIAFGDRISTHRGGDKAAARAEIETELAAAFRKLSSELQQTFRLTPDDMPHSPQERFGVR